MFIVVHVEVARDVTEPPHVVGPDNKGIPHPKLRLLAIKIGPAIHILDFLDGLYAMLPVNEPQSPPLISSHLFGVCIFASPWCMTTMVCLSSLNYSPTINAMIHWTYLSSFTMTYFFGGARSHRSILMSNLKSCPMKMKLIHFIVNVVIIFYIFTASTPWPGFGIYNSADTSTSVMTELSLLLFDGCVACGGRRHHGGT